MKGCVFCKVIQKKIPAQIVYEDKESLAFLDAFPCSVGQTLVIPKKHSCYIFDIEDRDYAKLLLKTKKIAKAIDKSLKPIRTIVVVEGFMIDHVHVRLHPCYERHLSLKPLEPRPSEKELEKTAMKIRSALN